MRTSVRGRGPCFVVGVWSAWSMLAACGLWACEASSDEATPSQGAAAQGGGGGQAAAGAAGQAGALTGGQAGQGAAGSASTPPPTEEGADDPEPIGGSRPAKIYVPKGYVQGEPRPLVVLLHGYGAGGLVQELLFRLRPQADERGFLYVFPEGTVDADNKKFWNATDACCDFGGTKVDDSGYLRGLIDEVKARYPVDPKRVFFVGHSNGGFMSHRMACDHADVIAAIGSLAGATYADATKCKPSSPVAVLQIHGTADDTVTFEGEKIGGVGYPGAKQTVETWATLDGCALEPDATAAPIDIDDGVEGAETSITRYAKGCQPGGHAELWAIANGAHIPALNAAFAPALVDFLFAHPKP